MKRKTAMPRLLFLAYFLLQGVLLAQNVGIGTTTPASKLSVNGNLAVGLGYVGNVAPANGAIIQGPVGIGTVSPTKTLDVYGDGIIDVQWRRYLGATSIAVPNSGATATFVQAFTWSGNAHTYLLFNVAPAINWAQAQELARVVNGYLPTLTSSAEDTYIRTNILSLPAASGDIPIGFTDCNTEGKWQWITGEIGVVSNNSQFLNWAPGEPNNVAGFEGVGHYFGTTIDPLRRWNDANISSIIATSVIVELGYTMRP